MALPPLAPDRVAGLLAVLGPLCLVSAILSFRRRAVGRWLVAVSLTLMILGLLATGSRAAWMALLAGVGGVACAGLWRRSALLRGVGRIALVLASILMAVAAWGAIRGVEDSGLGRLAELLASPDGVSRLRLARDTLDLIGDFPLTGAGLGSFPGLYSRYILAIPQLYLDHAHNLYLDIALSQGTLALLAFVAILLGGLARSARGVAGETGFTDRAWLQRAAFAGLIVISVFGLVDDPLESGVGQGGIPYQSQNKNAICSVYDEISAISCFETIKQGFDAKIIVCYRQKSELMNLVKIINQIIPRLVKQEIILEFFNVKINQTGTRNYLIFVNSVLEIMLHEAKLNKISHVSLALSPLMFSSDFIDHLMKRVFQKDRLPIMPLSGVDTRLFEEAKEIGLEKQISKLEKLFTLSTNELPNYLNTEIDSSLKSKKIITIKIGPSTRRQSFRTSTVL